MKVIRWPLAVIVALLVAGPARAGDLGEKAPPLTIKEWVKGDPVDVTKADGKNVYVVEFWATTCAPCRQSIPHLTEMQKKFKDKNVTFIGVSTDDAKTVSEVKPFVEKMGDKMNYVVAIDKDGATSKAYMDAHYIMGIPHAFIIDQSGRIVWHDHPLASLEDSLEKVVDGKFDLAAAKKQMAPIYEQRRHEWTQGQYVEEYFRLVQSSGNEKEAAELGKKLLDVGKDNAGLMNWLAWDILTAEGIVSRDLKLALTAAEAANKATTGQNPAILDTYALALFENDQKQEAVNVQLKAVRLAKQQYADQPEMIAELKGRLERFQKAVE